MAASAGLQAETWEPIPIGPDMEKEFFTEAEYFANEETAFGRWECVPVAASVAGREGLGVIRAMSGGTPDHSEIAGNVIRALGQALRAAGNRICHVYTLDMKVHCADGLNTFPDFSVVCGKPNYHAGKRHIVNNPILVDEVLSPSTETNDRGLKWVSYRTISTLQHYLLVSAVEPRVEVHRRAAEREWQVQFAENLEANIRLPALGVSMGMADLYDLVDFDAG